MLWLSLALQAAPAAAGEPSPSASTQLAGQTSVERTPRDWAATLRQDAQALHDDIAANHPGPVNAADPAFAKRNDAQLALALRRARTARSYGDYFFALRGYAASFDDGHLSLGAPGATPLDGLRWPGFLTNYDGRGTQRVVVRVPEAPVPIGAELLGCDGYTAEQTAARVLAPQWGRWQLEAQRRRFGTYLFSSEGNPYVPRPRRCSFLVNGKRQSVVLDWQPVEIMTLMAKEQEAGKRASYNFGTRTLPDGTRWYAIPSFNADPDSVAGKTLPGMIATMKADRDALARAPAIVLDLRGNGGGSSEWSRQIAEVLWGRPALDRLPAGHVYVEWRASATNLRSMTESYEEQRGRNLSPDADRWFRTVIAGMRGAISRGNALWKDGDEDDTAGEQPRTLAASPRPLAGPVFLVTDGSCGSACLDAVDLWRALGAVHVGRTTSADTLYMDVRRYELPSRLANGSMPMKVYRGRPRGLNEPVVPVHLFAGDITDTPQLQQWIATQTPK